MSFLLDHSNAEKTRRAIIVTSSVLIMFYYVKLNSPEIDIYGLKIAISKAYITVFGKISLGYLAFIFICQLFRSVLINDAVKINKIRFPDYESSDPNASDPNDDNDRSDEIHYHQEIDTLKDMNRKKAQKRITGAEYLNGLTTILLPILLAAIAILDWHRCLIPWLI